MPAMASRYDEPYKDYENIGVVKGPSAGERAGRAKAAKDSDFLRMLAGIAPIAGSALGTGIGALAGGPAGAMIGGGIGGGAGQLAGGLLGGAADDKTRDFDDREEERQAKLNALMGVLGGRR